MATDRATMSLTIETAVAEWVKTKAREENRTVSNYVETTFKNLMREVAEDAEQSAETE